MEIKWNAVQSSNIEMVGFEPSEDILYISFIGGTVYAYSGVEEIVYNDFMNAESKGKHFHKFIKGQYPCSKIED
jgi:hypothetical protein